jgi:hypothetical protein
MPLPPWQRFPNSNTNGSPTILYDPPSFAVFFDTSDGKLYYADPNFAEALVSIGSFSSLKRAPFNPDGVTTVWTLPSTPVGDIILSWNGQIVEPPGAYTIAGDVITTLLPFSSATPAAAIGDTLVAYFIPS